MPNLVSERQRPAFGGATAAPAPTLAMSR